GGVGLDARVADGRLTTSGPLDEALGRPVPGAGLVGTAVGLGELEGTDGLGVGAGVVVGGELECPDPGCEELGLAKARSRETTASACALRLFGSGRYPGGRSPGSEPGVWPCPAA